MIQYFNSNLIYTFQNEFLYLGCKGGYCFGVFRPDRTINWATAQSNCKSWGGDLASIRSIGEEEYILSLGETNYGSCWVGHHDRYNEAGTNATLFVSVGGSLSSYRNFYGNEPNQQGNEDCVMLRGWNEDGWSDTSCDATLGCYVCGKPSELIVYFHITLQVLNHVLCYLVKSFLFQRR